MVGLLFCLTSSSLVLFFVVIRWKGVKLRFAQLYGTLCPDVTAAFKSIYDTIPGLSGSIRSA